MDEYVISTNYMTNGKLLERGLELLHMLQEDMDRIGAEDIHQLQRTWELHHRLLASLSVTHHTLFREETRWPGYYYRGDFMNATTGPAADSRWRRRPSTTSSIEAGGRAAPDLGINRGVFHGWTSKASTTT